MTELLRIGYFFDESRRFPWDVLHTGVPRVGTVHSYLCTMLAPWVDEEWREFMRGLPSLRELRRAAKVQPGLISDIVAYVDQLEGLSKSERTDVAQEVLDFLARHQGFRKHAQKTLDRLWRQGLISVPKEAEPW